MATYVPIQSLTLNANTTYVTFANIDQSYTDLRLVMTPASSSGTNGIRFRVGNANTLDTGSNYSYTAMDGNGSTAGSYRESGIANGLVSYRLGIATSFTQTYVVDFMNYSNTTTFKTILGRYSDASAASGAGVFTWRSTAAINTISFSINTFGSSTGDFIAGSTFDLYGISPTNAKTTAASGGTAIYYDSTYAYHVFTGTGVFTPNRALSADVLVVAGGAGGGNMYAGGGGAGGVCYQANRSLTANTPLTVTIGAGGPSNGSGSSTVGVSGSNSVFDTITAIGGGGGGTYNAVAGVAGGSGGGGAMGASTGNYGSAGAATQGTSGGATGYGNAGGRGYRDPFMGGGGGGAGTAGGEASGSQSGHGGAGITNSTINTLNAFGAATNTGELSGGNYYYAGGGGGGAESATPGNGGLGGGGKGGLWTGAAAINGRTNTGGGGGGVGGNLTSSSSGGSGIVIVRYVR